MTMIPRTGEGPDAEGGSTAVKDPSARTRAWLLLFAILLRLAVAGGFPSLHHPDENFQFFEQAHRLAFGYGVVPWEFEQGIRSLLLPGVFAKLIHVLAEAGASPLMYIFVCRALLAALSLLIVAAVYDYGRRLSASHAIIGGLVAASWFEIVYFSGRPLTEAMAADFLVLGLALGSPQARPLSVSTLATIGACLGTCLMLRMQLAPGLVVAAIWICRADLRGRWLPVLAGAALPIAVFGISDWLTWGSPFHSQLGAFRANWLEGKASLYGVMPPFWYLSNAMDTWAGALPLLGALIVMRRRAEAMWIAVAAAIIISHSFIPHKEYRFIFPALACLVIVAAMGSADLVEAVRAGSARWSRPALLSVCAIWMLTSFTLAVAPSYRFWWFKDADLITAESALSRVPGLCGLLVYDYPWYESGGYAFLHRNVPIYRRPVGQPLARAAQAANYVFVNRSSIGEFGDAYRVAYCAGQGTPHDFCVIRRPGECVADPELKSMAAERGLGGG